MNSTTFVLCLAVFVTPLLSVAQFQQDRAYVQPALFYGMPSSNEYEDRPGFSLAVGRTFGERHTLELEGIFFETDSDTVNLGYLLTEKTLTLVPVLTNYRYQFPITERLSGFAGISAGVTFQKQEYAYRPNPAHTVFLLGGSVSNSRRDEVFTYGGQLGLTYRATDRLEVTLALRGLGFETKRDSTTSALGMVQLGVRLSF